MTEISQPFFRFLPRAYELEGVFESSDEPCPNCNQSAGWRYIGSVYSTFSGPVNPCAVCLSKECISELIGGGSYSLHDATLDVTDQSYQKEIFCLTPGFSTFNPFNWPSIEGVPMAFLGYGDEEFFQSNEQVHIAINAAGKEMGFDNWGYPSSYGLIFRSLDERIYRVVLDFD